MTPDALRMRKARLAARWRNMHPKLIGLPSRYVDSIIAARIPRPPRPTLARLLANLATLTEEEFLALQEALRSIHRILRLTFCNDPNMEVRTAQWTGRRIAPAVVAE